MISEEKDKTKKEEIISYYLGDKLSNKSPNKANSNINVNMNILARYVHGSEDSTDVDVVYVVDRILNFEEARAFCAENKEENRNVVYIENGIITWCFKGTPDEINNSLFRTYNLHEQTDKLLVERAVQRNIYIKIIRAIRIILSHLSRSYYRVEVKNALRGTFSERLNLLKSIEYNKIDNINLILGDIRDYKKLFNHEYYDLITVNPPYFKNQIENNNVEKKTARHEDITLEEIIEAARYMLKNDGRLALVHRTERLVEILDILRKNNLEPKRLEFIYKDEESNSKLMMIEAIKSGKPGLILEKPLYTHDKNGDYRENIKEIFHR